MIEALVADLSRLAGEFWTFKRVGVHALDQFGVISEGWLSRTGASADLPVPNHLCKLSRRSASCRRRANAPTSCWLADRQVILLPRSGGAAAQQVREDGDVGVGPETGGSLHRGTPVHVRDQRGHQVTARSSGNVKNGGRPGIEFQHPGAASCSP